MPTIDLKVLQAINDWQRGGDQKQKNRRGKHLKEVCSDLDIEFRTCTLVCYRQIALLKGDVWSLIGEGCLPERISAWTVDPDVAKQLKHGVPPEGYQGTILCLLPPPGSVVVNLWRLYRDPHFRSAMDEHCHDIQGYHEGAGRYGDSQCEVVLEVDMVSPEHVYSLGGYSSPFDELIERASSIFYRRTATDAEKQDLLIKASGAGTTAGAAWLNMEATQRVLAKTKPAADKLRVLKRLQDELRDLPGNVRNSTHEEST